MSRSEAEEKKKPVKLEDVAEETGEAIGKGLKKAWSVTKSFGKGFIDTIEKTEEEKETKLLTCPHCCTSVPPHSDFCVHCGKKL